MTTLDTLRDSLPEYARDLSLNLESVLAPTGAPGLTPGQIWAIALVSALASRNVTFARDMEALATARLDAAHLKAAHAAAAIMAMNNVYYRFLHLAGDEEYTRMPARLRMNVIGSPGIDKLDFELLCLAVSAINGCGMCIESHEKQLRRHGVTREGVQSAVRIAATVHAVARVLESAAAPAAGSGAARAA